MTGMERYTPTRRTLLSAMGTGFTTGLLGGEAVAKQSESGYVLVQGDECVPIRPFRGQLSVETFYEYQLPEKYVSDANGAIPGNAAAYSSAGTADLQRDQTSDLFLYQGPEGLSLVVVHGSLDSSNGGAATFRLSGLPRSGEWVVKDDFYRSPDTGDVAASNYDRWSVEGTDHRIDWTWGTGGTDGGAFRDLGDSFEVTIEPKFNESAALFGKHYEGTVTDWQFLSGSAGVSKRISLTINEPIRIETGSCNGGASLGAAGQRDDETAHGESAQDQQQEKDQNRGQQNNEARTEGQAEREGRQQKKEEKQEQKEERKEEEQEGKEERKEEEQEGKEERKGLREHTTTNRPRKSTTADSTRGRPDQRQPRQNLDLDTGEYPCARARRVPRTPRPRASRPASGARTDRCDSCSSRTPSASGRRRITPPSGGARR